MDINRIIDIIRTLKEEGMGVSAVSAGPTNKTGQDISMWTPVMSFAKRNKPEIIGKGTFPGARKRWRNGNVR